MDNIAQIFSHISSTTSTTSKKFTLILDLDETLIRSIITSDINKINQLKNMSNLLLHYLNGNNHIFVFYRPHMLHFLQEMSKYFDICVFTNGVQSYADIIITMINTITSYTYISRWYSRTGEYPFYKYISLIDHVDTSKVIIIDDNNEIWKDDSKNVIKIKQFYGPDDKNYIDDDHLLNLTNIISRTMNSTSNINVHDFICDIRSEYLLQSVST